ncbi:hypothetical protein ACKWTF_000876 [Chironomus riparius]
MNEDQNCPKCGGCFLGLLRSIVYGYIIISIIVTVSKNPRENCEKSKNDYDYKVYFTNKTPLTYCDTPDAIIAVLFIFSSFWFVVNILLLIGILKRNHKLIKSAVIAQGFEFGVSILYSVIFITVCLLNGVISYSGLLVVPCYLNFWCFNTLKLLYKIIKRDNRIANAKYRNNQENIVMEV